MLLCFVCFAQSESVTDCRHELYEAPFLAMSSCRDARRRLAVAPLMHRGFVANREVNAATFEVCRELGLQALWLFNQQPESGRVGGGGQGGAGQGPRGRRQAHHMVMLAGLFDRDRD